MLDFIEMTNEIDKVFGFEQRDCGKHYFPDSYTFVKWHKENNLPEYDSDGLEKHSSQIFYKQFTESGVFQTPYLDFWHWQLRHAIKKYPNGDIHKNGVMRVYVGKYEDMDLPPIKQLNLDDLIDKILDGEETDNETREMYMKHFIRMVEDERIRNSIPWQQEIQNKYHELYGHLADKDGYVECYQDW